MPNETDHTRTATHRQTRVRIAHWTSRRNASQRRGRTSVSTGIGVPAGHRVCCSRPRSAPPGPSPPPFPMDTAIIGGNFFAATHGIGQVVNSPLSGPSAPSQTNAYLFPRHTAWEYIRTPDGCKARAYARDHAANVGGCRRSGLGSRGPSRDSGRSHLAIPRLHREDADYAAFGALAFSTAIGSGGMRRPSTKFPSILFGVLSPSGRSFSVNVAGGMRITNGSTATARAARTRTSEGAAASAQNIERHRGRRRKIRSPPPPPPRGAGPAVARAAPGPVV